MACENQRLHFVLFPLMAQGHLIPMVDIAILLAKHGVTSTIVTTPQNVARVKTIIDHDIESKFYVHFIKLQFPCEEAGLPKDCDSLDLLPSLDMVVNLYNASNMLKEPVEKLFADLTPTPNCIISDMCLPWTIQIANKFQIPRLTFQSACCFCVLSLHNLHFSNVLRNTNLESKSVVLNLQQNVDQFEFTMSQLSLATDPKLKDFIDQMVEADQSSYGLVMNTFEELESIFVEEYKKVRKNKVWCIGPVSICNKDNNNKVNRGNKASIDDTQCLKWLDSKEPSSVLYVCFGSVCEVTQTQLKELGLGLESSKKPFIWVIKEGKRSEEIENWILEYGFERRTKDRGLLIRGWAPQLLILSHKAIGGFLTHCGWNSTLEAICAGVPMIAWPISGDQFFNEKLIVQVLKVGVSIGVENSEKSGVLVLKEEFNEAMYKLVNEDKADERRRIVKKLAEMAENAVEEGGSSYLNMTMLIQDIKKQAGFGEIESQQIKSTFRN